MSGSCVRRQGKVQRWVVSPPLSFLPIWARCDVRDARSLTDSTDLRRGWRGLLPSLLIASSFMQLWRDGTTDGREVKYTQTHIETYPQAYTDTYT